MAKKILLIDDEKDFTELTGTLLGFHELDVSTVNDPVAVENLLDTQDYALVVTDLMMPNLDGFDVIRKVRSRAKYAETPILVLSAKALTDAERKFLLQQKVHVLTKPFEPQGLVEQITRLLGE